MIRNEIRVCYDIFNEMVNYFVFNLIGGKSPSDRWGMKAVDFI